MEFNELTLKNGQYMSIGNAVEYESTISRSHFIASVSYTPGRKHFEETLRAISILHPKATHHCWAYRFIANPIVEHCSDAGEPAGTAGRPILGALKKYSLQNVAAVVTRYYGGIKLGVRGLIAAYGETTLRALERAKLIVREPMSSIEFSCPYESYNILIAILQKFKIDTSSIKVLFEENVSGELRLFDSIVEDLSHELEKISQGGKYLKYIAKKIDE
jgi:uncharacterized YigZ family protein